MLQIFGIGPNFTPRYTDRKPRNRPDIVTCKLAQAIGYRCKSAVLLGYCNDEVQRVTIQLQSYITSVRLSIKTEQRQHILQARHVNNRSRKYKRTNTFIRPIKSITYSSPVDIAGYLLKCSDLKHQKKVMAGFYRRKTCKQRRNQSTILRHVQK